MSDFTPTTAEVRQAYAAYMSSIQNPDWQFEPEFRNNQDRFDRWLARHDAEVLREFAERIGTAVDEWEASGDDEHLVNAVLDPMVALIKREAER